MSNRLTRDAYYLTIARATSMRSTCSRLNVGAIIVHNDRVLSTGYNGAPRGQKHCVHRDDRPCRVSVHAEVNALLFATYTQDSSLYVTHAPCYDCSKLIINAGIKDVTYSTKYRSLDGVDLLSSVGIDCRHIETEEM
jgi:dCMP deaminase